VAPAKGGRRGCNAGGSTEVQKQVLPSERTVPWDQTLGRRHRPGAMFLSRTTKDFFNI
jgi:hypothetical protein